MALGTFPAFLMALLDDPYLPNLDSSESPLGHLFL